MRFLKKISLLVLHGSWSLQTKIKLHLTVLLTRNSKMVLTTSEIFIFVVNMTVLRFDAFHAKISLLVLHGSWSLQTKTKLHLTAFLMKNSKMVLATSEIFIFVVSMTVSRLDAFHAKISLLVLHGLGLLQTKVKDNMTAFFYLEFKCCTHGICKWCLRG